MKFKLLAGVALAAVCAASGVSAQETGWYGAVDLGYHFPTTLKTESEANAPDGAPYHWEWASDKDWTGFVRLGYQFTPNWRAEVEGGYRPGDLTSVRGNGVRQQPRGLCTPGVVRTAAAPNCGSPDGSIDSWTLMANVLYDFAPDAWLNPFIGAGVGLNRLDVKALGQFSGVGAVTATNPAVQNLTVDDDDMAVAWQAIAGASIKATDKLKIDVTYRYLAGNDSAFLSTGSAALQPGVFQGQYKDQSVTVGLRYSFASPPPPPPPPAYEAREFIVYFPFDQSVLTPEAQSVVTEAANYANAGKATKLVVVGHTDTSGSPKYNAKLSERRAKAVADALVGQGVAAGALAVDWKGESAPAVATGDGVKEPLNRRSTISINF
jgi:OOP family OmpA-OmpF porin